MAAYKQDLCNGPHFLCNRHAGKADKDFGDSRTKLSGQFPQKIYLLATTAGLAFLHLVLWLVRTKR